MRKVCVALILALVAMNAAALSTKDLLATIAMPLAVAAVSNVSGVPQTQLATLVTTLNQANVPPVQFVEVIRYTPVALVDQNGEPFIAYVQERTTQGVTGDALVNAIAAQLQTKYNVTPQLELTVPATTLVVENNYVPPTVITRLGTVTTTDDPLALVALPLAVAAVADIAGVPRDQLADFVATLNNASVPATQMIEVVRYVPVALVDEGQPFVQFVQQQTAAGVTGPALVPVIVRRLQPYYPSTQINVVSQPVAVTPTPARRVFVEQDFVPPPVVVTRVEEVRRHPHGGPPGQIKKQLGLQTGAEVVHGEKPGRVKTKTVVVQPVPAPVAAPPPVIAVKPKGGGEKGHGKKHGAAAPMISSAPTPVPAAPPVVVAPQAVPGHGKGNAGAPPGQAKEQGKGKGKGKD
ncbi:MAG TPA: hypothetical protein VGK31_10805 [Thermoanaerobaculia bacterium]